MNRRDAHSGPIWMKARFLGALYGEPVRSRQSARRSISKCPPGAGSRLSKGMLPSYVTLLKVPMPKFPRNGPLEETSPEPGICDSGDYVPRTTRSGPLSATGRPADDSQLSPPALGVFGRGWSRCSANAGLPITTAWLLVGHGPVTGWSSLSPRTLARCAAGNPDRRIRASDSAELMSAAPCRFECAR